MTTQEAANIIRCFDECRRGNKALKMPTYNQIGRAFDVLFYKNLVKIITYENALRDIMYWDEEMEKRWGDPGELAKSVLKK